MRRLAFIAVSAAACQPPPPAPEGLDDSARYMVREFWSDDAKFQAGLQGFVNWFEAEGKSLLGLVPGENNTTTDAFTVTDLLPEDVVALPLDPDIAISIEDPANPDDDILEPRDLAAAAGVVSLAEMDCTWQETEQLLLRPDQDSVFPLDWEGYERTYGTPRANYEAASASGDFAPIEETIDPYAEDFDAAAYDSTILLTDNSVDPTPVFLGVNIAAYPLELEFRHGIYDLAFEDEGDPQPTGVFSILTYNRSAVWGPNGDNGLLQSFSIEINAERPGGKTLRMLAVWAQPYSAILSPDDPLALNYAVGKSRDSSVLLGKICSGEVEIDAE